jgi:predicted enzyme related to lactoylglutathione lyase
MTEVPNRRAAGTPCWSSLMAHRADRARDFYEALFGWEFTPGPEQLGRYVFAEQAGRRIAGIGEGAADQYQAVSWTMMLAVDDADQAAELVRERGGTVGVGPLDAGEDGRLAIAVDPSGAVFGIWEGEPAPVEDRTGEPGTAAWYELLTRESALVVPFYQAVFGFGAEPSRGGEADRVLLTVGGRAVAGVRGVGRDLSRERGAHWMTYFEVADVPGVVARTTELGGGVLEPPHDSRWGRTAALADPEGAAFSVITSTPAPAGPEEAAAAP